MTYVHIVLIHFVSLNQQFEFEARSYILLLLPISLVSDTGRAAAAGDAELACRRSSCRRLQARTYACTRNARRSVIRRSRPCLGAGRQSQHANITRFG